MPTVLECKLSVPDLYDAGYIERNGALPLQIENGRLQIAVVGDPDVEVLDDFARTFQSPFDVVPVSPEELQDAIRRAYAAAESMVELVKDLEDGDESAPEVEDGGLADARDLATQPPVVKFVNLLIRDAHAARASDIHLESTRRGLHARLRVDGVLTELPAPPPGMQAAIVSRVKLLADLDIAERRMSQDGRFRIRLEQRELDLRVSTMPTMYGESVVLRLLDRGGQPVGLDELGMAPDMLERFRHLAQHPSGLILATGPTGSGKTTTLYAALALRDVAAEKVITVEDPVEYHLEGVMQVPVNRKVGMTFATGLRGILRHDPDVLMIGEMRDAETAETATHSAMTGHLVFSTLHTNDALSAVTRLADLGVPRYVIGSTLEAVLAQRLVRKICTECRAPYRPNPQAAAQLSRKPMGTIELWRGRGCAACRETGYRGRTGIFELFALTEDIQDAIVRDVAPATIREMARAEGFRTLHEDSWAKVETGITTIEEVLRVTEH